MMVSSVSSGLLVAALAAAGGQSDLICPEGFVCIEESRAAACTSPGPEAAPAAATRPPTEARAPRAPARTTRKATRVAEPCPAPCACDATPTGWRCPPAGACEAARVAEPCAPARACEVTAQPVPAVAHREAPAPTPAVVPASASTAPATPAAASSSTPAAGDTSPGRRPGFQDWAIGVGAGLNFGSTLWLDEGPDLRTDHDTDSAPAFLVWADALTDKGVSVGGILYSTALDGSFGDANLLGVGATLKARFHTRSNLQLRPGVLLAYQKLDVDGLDEASTGLGAGVMLDVAASMGESFGVVTTLGILGQPAGGTGEADLTFGPAFFWTAGIEFGE